MNRPGFILIVCEGKTEAQYFSILQRSFRLPTYVRIVPDINEKKYCYMGQHEKLIDKAAKLRAEFAQELGVNNMEDIKVWAVCDRDNYTDSFTKLNEYANKNGVNLAFSDPQFENYLLQHFSPNKSTSKNNEVEKELSAAIYEHKPHYGLYRKNDLTWLEEMIDEKHAIVKTAAKNAAVFSRHTKQPFFTVQYLVNELLDLVD